MADEELNDVEIEDPSTSEENTEIEGQVEQNEEGTTEGEQPKADGSFVETDSAKFVARVGKLTSQRKQAEDKAAALQVRLDKIEADNLQAIINKPAPTEEQHQFDTEAYEADLAAHNQAIGRAQGQQEEAVRTQQQRAVDAQNQLNQVYGEKVVKFAEKTPDFVVSVGALAGLNQQVMNHIQALENGPEVAYELSKNMDLANQLNNAANAGDAITAGSVLAQVQAGIKAAPKDKKVTAAGDPIESPIQGGVSPDNPDKGYKHISGAKFS